MPAIDHLDWPLTALPVISTAGRFPLDDRDFDTTYHTASHALHVHLYDATMRLDDRTVALRPGDFTLSPAGWESRYHLPVPGHHWCVHIMPAVKTLAPTARLPLHLPLGRLGTHAGQKIMTIAQTRAAGGPLAAAAASAACLELILWFAQQAAVARRTSVNVAAASRGMAAAERVAAILHERLEDEISIPALADEVELTQNYLARIFRLRYGMTMPHYLLTCRIDHAKHLLAHTAIPISRVAERAGMPDVQHFNKQFRRLAGQSPSAYRGASHKSGK